MKKYLILSAAALLALAACTKQVPVQEEQGEISFQVANVVQTKADQPAPKPVEFTNADFGAYSWLNGTAPGMVNEKVAKVGTVWKTVDNTYYWPKTGSLDFICYSPFNEGTPTVAPDKIAWTKYTVSDKDLMYADKALKQTANLNTYYANGVPTLFHHALARLSFKVKASFLTYTQKEEKDATGKVIVSESTTTWEVTLKSAKLSGVRTTGDLTLAPAADGTWPLPEVGELKAHVWANPSGAAETVELVTTKDDSGALSLKLTTEAQDLNDGKVSFVLPQLLVASADAAAGQTLALNFHIKTTLSSGAILEEDYVKTLDLKAISSIPAWQMNQNIVYTINIKPTAIADELVPYTDDPTDVEITFDPATAGWETVDADATILI